LKICLKYETMGFVDVIVLEVCQREIKEFPDEVKDLILDSIALLRAGHTLSMPLSRPMPSIGKGVYELRYKDKKAQFRVGYFVKKKSGIYLLHAFKKKDQKTPKKNIDLIKKRMRKLL